MQGNLDALFQIIPILVICGFAAVTGAIIYTVYKGIALWDKNNQQRISEVIAKVVTKRTSTHDGGNTR